MSDDKDAVRQPQSARVSRTVSRTPAPAPRIEPSAGSPGKSKKNPTDKAGLEKLKQALWQCEQLIRAARTLRRFRGSLWDAEKKRWDIYRPQIEDGLKLCREAGRSEAPEVLELLPRIEVLDSEWSVACELRRRGNAPSESDAAPKNRAVAESTPLRVSKAGQSDTFASFARRAEQISAEEKVRQGQERLIDIEKSVAQCRRFESERVRAKPDWSKWNVLSWIAFRDLALLCEIQNDGELRQVVMYGHSSLKAATPERLLISALARGHLHAIKDGEKLKAHHWFGKSRIDRDDIWFDRDQVIQIWRDDHLSLGQMMLWIITRDQQQVEDARASGLEGAWAALVIEQRPQNQIQHTAGELTELCRQGAVQTFDGHSPIKPEIWKDLEIGFREGIPFVRRRARSSEAFPEIGFSRIDALRRFPPDRSPDDVQEPDADMGELRLREQRRRRTADWFNRRQERTPLGKRVWLGLVEIADEYARKPGSLAVDEKERERALDALRRSILAREFIDQQGRSRILNMHPSRLADFRFDPSGARHPDLFDPIAHHLWITYQDCARWFNRRAIPIPLRLRREGSPMIAVGEAINGAVNLYASGIAQVGVDCDGCTGEVSSPPLNGVATPDVAQAPIVPPDGGSQKEVPIDVDPYSIERENPHDTPQIRLARWIAWQRWPDGQIPRIADTHIQLALNKKLNELYSTKLPLELKGDVKPGGIKLPTVRRLLGKRKD
jgi:hypothetical protein